MCLILFSHRSHPQFRLLIAANRDEFYSRPTAPADFWPEQPDLLGGRDLQAGGTWLGVNRAGRLAALTNYRDPRLVKPDAPSRGGLVTGFLTENRSARDYMEAVAREGKRYNGFNLLAADLDGLFYYGNRCDGVRQLAAGVYGLSNHLLDTPWPKVVEGKKALAAQLTGEAPFDPEAIFAALADRSRPPDDRLPETGVGLDTERMLSPAFITSEIYGTRSSMVVALGNDGTVRFLERTFEAGEPKETRSFFFELDNPPPSKSTETAKPAG